MKQRIKLSILWITSFIIIIFIMCFRVHAEESSYFPMGQDDNSLISDTFVSYCETTYDSVNNDIFICYYNIDGSYYNVVVYVVPRSNAVLYAEVLSNGYQFQPYFSNISDNMSDTQVANSITLYWLDVRISDSAVWPVQSTVFQSSTFNSSLYANNCSYSSNFRLYKDNNETDVVLNYGSSDPVLDVGVAIIPPEPILPDYPSGITPPSQVPPTFTSSDYNWTTPPTFDSSSIENAIGSIQNTLGWIANNLKEEFKNLTNNLKGFFKYIGDTIQYYGNALLSTLNNFIQNFYDNMKSLVEPIFQKIDYITTPLEADIIWDNISGTSLITNYSSIINAASSMKNSFENLSEPTDYKIPIHLENLPSSWFGNLTTQYIDLGVINPVKTILRTFMWALITYSLFVTIIDSIANYINGGGDES